MKYRFCVQSCTPSGAGITQPEFFADLPCDNPHSRADGEAPRILVAEDNQADVYLIRAALKEHGIALPLKVAVDGAEVLRVISECETLTENRLELIILDLNLPRHDGIEILERLHATRKLAAVPVVVLTSSDSPNDRTAARQLGAVRFLRKPSSLEEFLGLGAIFRDILRRDKAPREPGAGDAR